MTKKYTVKVNRKDLSNMIFDNSVTSTIDDILANYTDQNFDFLIEVCLDGYCISEELNIAINYLTNLMLKKREPYNLFEKYFDINEKERGFSFEYIVRKLFKAYLSTLINGDDNVYTDEFEVVLQDVNGEKLSTTVFLKEDSFEKVEYYDKLMLNKGKYIEMFTFNYMEKYRVKNTKIIGFVLPLVVMEAIKSNRPVEYWIQCDCKWFIRAVK